MGYLILFNVTDATNHFFSNNVILYPERLFYNKFFHFMDVSEFRKEVFSLKDLLYRLALRMLNNTAEAEDAVQQTLMKMWQIREDLNRIEQLRSFVIRSLKNDCLNRLKREQTISRHHLQLMKSQQSCTQLSNGNMIELIKTEISKLPEKQRIIIQLSDVEGFDAKEIASIIQIDENAVRVNLTRARKKVKMQIQKIKDYDARQL